MTSFRILTTLVVLAASALANNKCFTQHSERLAELSTCGDKNAIIYYLEQLDGYDLAEVTSVFIEAGCSPEDAGDEAKLTIRRCRELFVTHELRRVRRQDSDSTTAESETTTAEAASSSAAAATTEAETTTAVASTTSTTSTTSTSTSTSTTSTTDATTTAETTATSTATATSTGSTTVDTTASSTATASYTGGVMSGTVCFTTSYTSTSACDVETSDGHVKTNTCTPTNVLTSTCQPSLLCTTNSVGDICMELQGIQTDGIIIAIVFVAIIIVFFSGVCYASMRDSKRQKIAAEKAEAVALTRAMTKRKRMATAASAGV